MTTQRANPLDDSTAGAEVPQALRATAARSSLYLTLLNWAFALFSSTRLFTYLPTLFAIHHSGDSSQHSLWTWFAWVGSNAAMAAWLYENNARRVNKAILGTGGNAFMGLATCALILGYRELTLHTCISDCSTRHCQRTPASLSGCGAVPP